jgi:hypothetical protein
MATSKYKLAVGLALILSASSFSFAKAGKRMQYDQSIQAHDAPMPQEVLSAKTIAVMAKVIGGPNSEIAEYKQRIQASAIAEIQKHNRFQLVSDPAKADLVCLLIEFSYDYWREAHSGGHGLRARLNGQEWSNAPPEAIIVLKGGNDAHRTARPVWMESRIMRVDQQNLMHVPSLIHTGKNKTPTWMMKDFHSAFAKAEKKGSGETESSKDDASELEPDNATAPSGTIGPSANDKFPVFCPPIQSCLLPSELITARTAIVCDPIYSCNDENMEEDVAWGGRWKLTADPAKADLIVVLCRTPSNSHRRTVYYSGRVQTYVTYTGLYVFPGGEQPDWTTMPLYLEFGQNHELTLKYFEKLIAEAHRP